MGPTTFVGARELHRRPKNLLKQVSSSSETCYITDKGKAKAVLMGIHRYNALMDLVEDAESTKEEGAGEKTRMLASVKGILRRPVRTHRRKR